ncbi:MAG: hypothetical protein V2A72_05150 [Candidatus Omnitrophota bacterium]
MQNFKTTLGLIGILLITITTSGCSVGMALSGKKDVDKSLLKVGQPRVEVVNIVGEPKKTMTTETGRTDIFECQRGNAPSAGRAVGHAVMDVLTWGAWEIIGTPVEGLSTSKYYISISYDKEDKVTDIKTSDELGPLDFN